MTSIRGKEDLGYIDACMACVIICVRMATGSGYNYGYCCGNTQATRAPDSQPAVNDFPISTKKPAEPSPYHAVLKLLVLGDSGT